MSAPRDLVVIVPSRGRPDAVAELADSFAETCTSPTRVVLAVDADDPQLPAYRMVCATARATAPKAGSLPPLTSPFWVELHVVDRPSTMVYALNDALKVILGSASVSPYAVGFMGDDHRPRTVGWDTAYLAALGDMGTGIVYGNDLFQGENLPTQCAMTSDIPCALGFMAPPGLRHMYVDNFWRDLGIAAACLKYLPEVVVEHVHPAAGKASLDAGYERVNAPEVYAADEAVYRRYRGGQMAAHVTQIQHLRVAHEWRLFPEGTVPEYTRPEWYSGREHAPHLEQDGHRDRLMQTATCVALAAFRYGIDTVVDLGAGDGGLLSLLGPALTAWGYDLMPANLAAARERGADVRPGDVVEGAIEWGGIAVCTEMLEHLVDPHQFVRRIAENAKVLVCSSPREERPGSAYEYHAWAWDMHGYRTLVEQAGFKVMRQYPVHGFQVILAVRGLA